MNSDQALLNVFQRLPCNGKNQKKKIRKLKITILGRHVATYVRICVFEAQKFVHLRAILADFPDTNHQELPGA